MNEFAYRSGDGVVSGGYDEVPGNSDEPAHAAPDYFFGTFYGFPHPRIPFDAALCVK